MLSLFLPTRAYRQLEGATVSTPTTNTLGGEEKESVRKAKFSARIESFD